MNRVLLTLTLSAAIICTAVTASNAQLSPCRPTVVPDAVRGAFGPKATVAFLPKTSCADHREVCAEVENNYYFACWFLGEGDCFCKSKRQFNKCMKDVGCSGYSDQFMLELGCSMID